MSGRIGKDGVLVNFVPRDAHLNFEETRSEQAVRSIAMRLELEGSQIVRLSENQTLKNAQWHLYLKESMEFSEGASKIRAIGALSFSDDEEEECLLGVALKPDKFTTLLSAIQNGQLPQLITVTVQGLSYAAEGLSWNIKTTPGAPITKIAFCVPLAASRIGA